MEEQQLVEQDLHENLLAYRSDMLQILINICIILSIGWFVLLLSRINRQMSDLFPEALPWAVFTACTGGAYVWQKRNSYSYARTMFFLAIIAAPSLALVFDRHDTSFMAYSLIIAVMLAGGLISTRTPFSIAAICTGIFIAVGLVSEFELIQPPLITNFDQFFTLFAGPTLLLYIVALASWLASRDLVSSVSWAMESNRLAERRAQRLSASETRVARTLLELEGSYDVQSRLNIQLQQLNQDLESARAAADEANNLKTRFLANMSHELRTPLNAIINFTQFLGKPRYGELSERQLELQERVLVNSEQLLGLINDILDLSKIEAGRMELQLEALELGPIFNGVMATAVGLTKSKGLLLKADVEEDLPAVRGDKIRVRQILLNLLSNAAKFTDEGGLTLRAFERDDFVQISVIDTGGGIPPHELPRVFEEFHQVEQAASAKRQQGTGLGLPISRHLVELQGGQMWVESALNVGSTFSFTLPIAHDFISEVVIFEPTEQAVV